MRSAEQGLNKWLEMRKAEFHDGTDVVGEKVALSRNGTSNSAGTSSIARRNRKIVRIAAIALKLRLDSDELAEIKSR